MVTCISRSPEATFALGEDWGRAAAPGWVVALTGELGAGKTQLVKGLAHGLAIGARVHSPTFALMLEYGGGRLSLVHLDFYRLEKAEQVIRAGLDEYLSPTTGVTVVEWAERWFDDPAIRHGWHRPGFLRRVWIECLAGDERRVAYEDSGP